MLVPTTEMRVPEHTPAHINRRIRLQMQARVEQCGAAGRGAIEARLRELDAEWDMERILEANAATVSLVGLSLAAEDRRWLVLPMAVAGFLLLHAVHGWCPPVPLFRRLGVRTAGEIAEERYALKALRGDFAGMPAEPVSAVSARRALLAAAQ